MQDKRITALMRSELKKPLGRLLRKLPRLLNAKEGQIISVGDITTLLLLKHRIVPSVSFIDFKCKRRRISDVQMRILEGFEAITYRVRNPPGMLSGELMGLCKRLFSRKLKAPVKIYVEGEEDLAVLAAAAYAPLKSFILYGQPDQGVVIIRLTQRLKRKARKYYANAIEE